MNLDQDPAALQAKDVCPHCKVPLFTHRFECKGVTITTYHCLRHHDVIPMCIAVSNSPAPLLYPTKPEVWYEPAPAERCDEAAAYAC